MPDNAPPFLHRTKALVALPGRFTAFEHRQGAIGDHLIQALEESQRQVAEVTQALGDAREAARAEAQEAQAAQAAVHAAVQAAVQALQGELGEVRAELAALRRLVEGHLVAEAESVELVGRLLERAEGRLDALEQQQA